MGMAKTKTCGDCIHADICEHLPNLPLFHRKNEAHCVTFKDKADLVEVVRCKDCRYFDGVFGHCDNHGMAILPNEFCSYGERREGDG